MFWLGFTIVILALVCIVLSAIKDAGERTEDDGQYPGDHVVEDAPKRRKGPKG